VLEESGPGSCCLAGSRVISRRPLHASALVTCGAQPSQSCPAVGQDATNSNISVDQPAIDHGVLKRPATALPMEGDPRTATSGRASWRSGRSRLDRLHVRLPPGHADPRSWTMESKCRSMKRADVLMSLDAVAAAARRASRELFIGTRHSAAKSRLRLSTLSIAAWVRG
jgi:hypothetical protein